MSEPSYEEIRSRITERYNNRIGFFSHLIAFLVLNGFGWVLWLWTPEAARSGALSVLLLITTVGWLVGILIHALVFWMTEARERAIERAVEREWGVRLPDDKPKRDWGTRLTEDGELVDSYDEVVEDTQQRRAH